MYRIVRIFRDRKRRIIKKGLTLEEAQAHCKDPETSARTCKSAAKIRYTKINGYWFDAYEEQ